MRLAADERCTVTAMTRSRPTVRINRQAELQVRLHDIATGFAIGIAALKGAAERIDSNPDPDFGRALELLVGSLGQLRKLVSAPEKRLVRHTEPASLLEILAGEARRLGIKLEPDLIGHEAWLPPNHLELVELTCREAIRNVARHAATKVCEVRLNFSTCPYQVRVRDWGTGVQPRSNPGNGLALLQRMAADIGCQLNLGSQPGLGTDVVLVGPPCANERDRSSKASRGSGDGIDRPAEDAGGRTRDGRRRSDSAFRMPIT